MNKQLPLIFLFLILAFISLSYQKEETKAEENTEETNTIDINEDNNQTSSTHQSGEEEKEENFTPLLPDKYTQLPEAKVILPIRRIGTSESTLNASPCGGILRKQANTLTNRGANIHVVWETVVPTSNGNCTVKISPGLEREDNFTILYPIDNIATSQGAFPCGRTKGFDGHEFILPDDYVCDKCTLQWNWSTPYGNIYSCSDIIINGEKIGNCLAKCQHGGSCFNGKCLCLEGFEGEFCQSSTGTNSAIGRIILYVILALILIAVLIYGIYFLTTKFFSSWLKPKQDDKILPFPNNKDAYMIDEGNN